MSYTPPVSALRRDTSISNTPSASGAWRAGEVTRRPPRALPLARRYEIDWLGQDGAVHGRVEIGPALPAYEEAFSAFTHGVPIQTTAGEVPVEDLMPGAILACPNGSEAKLMWKGAITLVPGAPSASGDAPRLTRVTADSFGPGRPYRDLLFGPSARRLVRGAEVPAGTGREAALAALSEGVDGISVIEVLPVQPMRVYHLVAQRHATILAGGVEVGTYHPGPDHALSLSAEMLAGFLALFPHLDPEAGFGRTLWPRLDTEDVEG